MQRLVNENAKSNTNLEISQAMDAPVNFDSNSSLPLDKADPHIENFSAIAQQQRQQGHADPFGEGPQLVGQKGLEVLFTGWQAPCNCEELQHDLAIARADMELAAVAAESDLMGGEIVTEWETVIETAKAKSRMLWRTFEQLIGQALSELGLDSGAATAKHLAVALAASTTLLLLLSCCCFCSGSAI